MRKVLSLLTVGLLFVLALPLAAQDASTPQFEPARCMFILPSGQDPECGYLIVPENRGNPDSKTIKLAVAIFRSTDADRQPDPVINLEGGPGGSVLENLSLTFNQRFGELIGNRDLILFDQRGVGYSQPALDCQEYNDFFYESLDQALTVDEYVQKMNQAMTDCAKRLADDGLDLEAYNSVENAADVNDLRLALGYEQVNLYGTSYGTRLALTVMRDHPEGVRSTVIDSIYPLEITNFDAPLNYQRSLNLLFAGCAADPKCDAAYPDLEQVFYHLIEQLNASPISFNTITLTGGLEAQVDGHTFASLIFQSLYSSEIIPSLPQSIYQVKDGNYQFLQVLTSALLLQIDMISIGMNFAVQCNEEYPFDTIQSINARIEQIRPELLGFARESITDPSILTTCKSWSKDQPDPAENQPISSDIPTLVLSGEYDPITPPEYGRLVAANLSSSYFFEFPGLGHGVTIGGECPVGIMQAFINLPSAKPDAACINDMTGPAWVVPGAAAAIVELESFSNGQGGYSGLKPVGWDEVMANTYARQSTGLDQTALTIQVLPGGGVDFVLPLIAGQFGVSTDEVTIREANGLRWRVLSGQLQDFPVDLAITDQGGQVYLIVLISGATDEQSALREQVFLPVVDAFKVE